MKPLLEQDFTAEYDRSGNCHIANISTVIGTQSFGDSKTCSDCNPFFRTGGCDHNVFNASFTHAVSLINIEEFINGFKKIVSERCDLLFWDDDKIVLADMYCGKRDYISDHTVDGKSVAGKKTKVRLQIESTLNLLYSVESIRIFVNRKGQKLGIMAYRNKYEGHFEDTPAKVKASVRSFLRPTDAQSRRNLATPIAHGFSYIMCKYPTIYQ